MTKLEIKNSKYWGGGVRRTLEVTPLKIIGDINNVPIDKTYQNDGYKRMEDGTWKHTECMLKLQIEERGFITQRTHNLYKSSKKGYYSVVCQHKVYFTDEEIESLESEARK